MTVIHITFDQTDYNHHNAHTLLETLAGHIQTAAAAVIHPTINIGTAGRTSWWGDIDLHSTQIPSYELVNMIHACCPDQTGMRVKITN